MLDYRLMTIDDYEAAYDLWIKCGNGLNNKDDSYEGIEKYLKRNPGTSYVAVLDGKVVGVILCGHDGRRGIIQRPMYFEVNASSYTIITAHIAK